MTSLPAPDSDDLFGELTLGARAGASDWQYRAGEPVAVRIGGRIVPIAEAPVSDQRVRAIAAAALGVGEAVAPGIDACFTHGGNLYRFHSYTANGAYCFSLRRLPETVPELDDLGLPTAFARTALAAQRGLVLVTGPTGSGKSTTLAAVVDRLNRDRAGVIFTLEDPIEYRHVPKRSVIRQLAKGIDFDRFAAALHGALRADPDIILVGEMRDRETIAAALSAAETGHLVLATLHAPSASEAVARITGAFSAEHAPEIRAQCAQLLVAVLAQQLVQTPAQTTVAAFELLIATPGVKHLIQDSERRLALLANEIATGRQAGMVTMDQSLGELWRRGLISRSEALRAAFQPATLEPLLRRSA